MTKRQLKQYKNHFKKEKAICKIKSPYEKCEKQYEQLENKNENDKTLYKQ